MKRVEILREKIKRLVPLLTGMSIRVTQAGASAYVERDPETLRPNRVNLPYIPDDASDSLINAIEGFVDHEVGHCLFTGEYSWQRADKEGVLATWNAVEDVYVERKIAEMFPGSKSNLAKLRSFFIENYTEPQVKRALASGEDTTPYLMVCAYRAWAGQQTFVDYMADKWGLLGDIPKVLADYCQEVLPDVASSEEAVDIAIEIKKRLKQEKPEPPPMPQPEPENQPEQQTGGKGETPEEEGEGPSSEPNDNDDENGEPSNADREDDPSSNNGSKEGSQAENTDEEKNDESGSDGEQEDEESSDSSDSPESESGPDSPGETDDESESDPQDGEEGESQGDADDSEQTETPEEQGDEPESDNADEADGDEGGVSAEKAGSDAGNGDDDDGEGNSAESDSEPESEDPSNDGQGDNGGTPESEDGPGDEDPADIGKDDYNEKEDMEILDATDEQFMPGGGKGNGDIQPSTAENPGVMPVEEEPIEPVDFEAIQANMEDFDDSMSDLLTDSALSAIDASEYKIFSREYDYVGPLTYAHIDGVTDQHVINMTNKVDSMLGPMQKDLERLIEARSRTVWTGGHKKGRLNATALNRLVVSDDPRIFKQKQPARSKSVAVGILGDLSGSMQGTKVKTAAYAMYGLAKVLDKMHIPVEVLGFTTTDDEDIVEGFVEDIQREQKLLASKGAKLDYSRYLPLFVPVLKSFNQRMTPEVIKHLAAVASASWLNYNVDGECVQIAANRIMQRQEDRKILFVLSDGSPASAGSSRAVMNAHLRKTVRDVEKSGIEIIGIGIEDDSVRSFYPKSVVINRVEELPSLVIGKMKEFLSQN